MTYDVAIVGGGMVGAALGVALAPLGIRVVIIEAVPYDSALQPSFDERTTALSNGSRRILESMVRGPRWPRSPAPYARSTYLIKGASASRASSGRAGLGGDGICGAEPRPGRALWSQLQADPGERLAAPRLLCPAQVTQITPKATRSRCGSIRRMAARG